MKTLFKKFLRQLPGMSQFDIVSILRNKYYALKSERVAAKMAKAGSDIYFQKVGLLHNPTNIFLGSNINFGPEIWLSTWNMGGQMPKLEIEDNCCFGAYNNITCANRITIGSGCLTGKWVTITDANSTSKCKITKCFCKSTPLVLRNSISFLVSH